jgi:hypothetical protein
MNVMANSSEFFRVQQRKDQVGEQPNRHRAAEDDVEGHDGTLTNDRTSGQTHSKRETPQPRGQGK